MGIYDFKTFGFGETAQEAYEDAVREDLIDNPLRGTISTTKGFYEVKASLLEQSRRLKGRVAFLKDQIKTLSTDPNNWGWAQDVRDVRCSLKEVDRVLKLVTEARHSKDKFVRGRAILEAEWVLEQGFMGQPGKIQKRGLCACVKVSVSSYDFRGWSA